MEARLAHTGADGQAPTARRRCRSNGDTLKHSSRHRRFVLYMGKSQNIKRKLLSASLRGAQQTVAICAFRCGTQLHHALRTTCFCHCPLYAGNLRFSSWVASLNTAQIPYLRRTDCHDRLRRSRNDARGGPACNDEQHMAKTKKVYSGNLSCDCV